MPHLQKLLTIIKTKQLQIIILTIITFLAYGNTLQNDFAYDDNNFILEWQTTKSTENFTLLLEGEVPKGHQGIYRPVRSFIYYLSNRLWGLNPLGYHLQAILVQVTATILVFLIVEKITRNKLITFSTALIFAVHPIHTEAISFTTASFDTFGIVFFLISFYLYLLSRENEKRRRNLLYIGSLVYAVLAFFTYEMTLVLPLIIVFYDLIFKKLPNKNQLKTSLLKYLPYFVLSFSYVVIKFAILNIGSRADYLGENFLVGSKVARVETLEILAKYLLLIIAPYNLTINHSLPNHIITLILSFFEKIDPRGKILFYFSRADFLIPLLLISVILIILVKLFKNKPIIAFSISLFFIPLLTVSNILPQGTLISERYLYISSIGFSLLTAFAFYNLYYLKSKIATKLHLKQIIVASFILLISFYGFLTFNRNRDWKNSVTIWSSAVKIDPTNTLNRGALALSYIKNNQMDLALNELLYLRKVEPEQSLHLLNLGHVYQKSGQIELAINTFKEALEIDPENINARFNLAHAYENKGEKEKARAEYQRILEIDSKNIPAYSALAGLYQRTNQFDLAVGEYKKLFEINSNNPDTHFNLATLYEDMQETKLAVEEYKKALTLNPYHSQSYNNLGVLLGKSGQIDLAISTFKEALEIDPENINAHFNLALIYENKGEKNKALAEYQKILEIDPTTKEASEKVQSLRN